MTTPCPVCGSTDAHCYSLRRTKAPPHQARTTAAIEVTPRLGQRIEKLAGQAGVPVSVAAEWLIWRALAADGGPIPLELLREQHKSWRRLERFR